MILYRNAALILLVAAMHSPAQAAPDARAQVEIAHLLDYVARPGCQFQRNGSWHDGAEARRHLQRKYDYLLKRDLVANAESFIARAASESSLSGRNYQVRCGGGKPVASAAYLTQELTRFRARGH